MPVMEDKQLDTLERILKFAENYGLSFVFLAVVLCLILYMAIVAIRLLQKWVPAWFVWSIKSHQHTIRFLDAATETLSCIHDKDHAVVEGCHHLAEAALAYARKQQTRSGIGSDVITHLTEAADVFGFAKKRRVHPRPPPRTPDSPAELIQIGEVPSEPEEPSPLEGEKDDA